jgi:hypothetical protein
MRIESFPAEVEAILSEHRDTTQGEEGERGEVVRGKKPGRCGS